MTRPTLVDLNLDEKNQGLRCYLVIVNLDRCHGSCNTLDDLSEKICVPIKTKDVNTNSHA